jgi:hypothetical protein
MNQNLIIERIVFAVVMILLLVISLLILISAPGLFEDHSVYQIF